MDWPSQLFNELQDSDSASDLLRSHYDSVTINVRFGSLAAPRHRTSPMSAFGGEADVQLPGKPLK